jgi:hypothetical protein
MDEWAACIDAITFIFQARTTPINNEKEKRGERESEEENQEYEGETYTCTLLALVTVRANLWACVYMVNE